MSEYSTIRNPDDLMTGDHASWPTEVLSGMLEHHAIVVAPIAGKDKKMNVIIIHVTEYDPYKEVRQASCPSSGSSRSGSYFVYQEIRDMADVIEKGELRRYIQWPKKTGPLCYITSNFRNTA